MCSRNAQKARKWVFTSNKCNSYHSFLLILLIHCYLSRFAIGGLSGGESKDEFWRIVSQCTDLLPKDKPRYCMGVGYGEDLVVCSALGVDMYDCVFPTRTARFGNALTRRGYLKLKKKRYANDFQKIEETCTCSTCCLYSRAVLFQLFDNNDSLGCQLLSVHNIAYQMRLMQDIRDAIEADTFPEFIRKFMFDYYKNSYQNQEMLGKKGSKKDPGKLLGSKGYPVWIENALTSVNIVLD